MTCSAESGVRIPQLVPRSLQDPRPDTTDRTLDPILSTESSIALRSLVLCYERVTDGPYGPGPHVIT